MIITGRKRGRDLNDLYVVMRFRELAPVGRRATLSLKVVSYKGADHLLHRSGLEELRTASSSPRRSLIAGPTLAEVPLTGLCLIKSCSPKKWQCLLRSLTALTVRGYTALRNSASRQYAGLVLSSCRGE